MNGVGIVAGNIFLLLFGIILLIKGADYFVDSGSAIGKTLKISEIILRGNYSFAWNESSRINCCSNWGTIR